MLCSRTVFLVLVGLLLGVVVGDELPRASRHMTEEEVQQYMKRFNEMVDEHDRMPRHAGSPVTPGSNTELPDNYNFGDIFTPCEVPSKEIMEECYASFAVMVADSYTERRCMYEMGTSPKPKLIELSSQALLSCETEDNGCGGGDASNALRYLVSTGVPTASCFQNYFSDQESEEIPEDVFCPLTCEDGSSLEASTYRASHYYRISGSNALNQMYEEIFYNGPIIARMQYSTDVESYTGGVYSHFSGEYSGYFWVRIKGWGINYNTPYWIVQTPFGTEFGDNGYMKVERGVNESGIEEMVYALMPEL